MDIFGYVVAILLLLHTIILALFNPPLILVSILFIPVFPIIFISQTLAVPLWNAVPKAHSP
jgi:hypothetical protein